MSRRAHLLRAVLLAAALPAAAAAAPPVAPDERLRPPGLPVSFQAQGHVSIGGDYRLVESPSVSYQVPPSAFQLRKNREEDGWELRSGFGFVTAVPDGAGDIDLVAPLLDLPAGATIEAFTCFVYDNVELVEAPGEPDIEDLFLHMDLVRHLPGDTGPSERVATAAYVTEDANPFVQSNNTDGQTIEHPVVDAEFAYRVEGLYLAESQGSSLRFYGCRIRLRPTRIDPR